MALDVVNDVDFQQDPLKLETEIKIEDPLKLDENPFNTSMKTELYPDSTQEEEQYEENRSYKKKYECDKCKKTFPFLYSFTAHSKKIHEKAKVNFHKCDFCDEETKTLQKMVIHIQNNHKFHKKQEMSKCNFCDMEFKNISNLVKHKKVTHLKCDICGIRFPDKHNLDEHIETQHKGKKNFCEICEKSFNSKDSFNCHF